MMSRFRAYVDNLNEACRGYYASVLDSWDSSTLVKAEHLAQKLDEAGCRRSEGWVFSEIGENIAQSARFALIQAVWERVIRPTAENEGLVESELAPETLKKFKASLSKAEQQELLIAVAKSVSFGVLNVLDESFPDNGLPGWCVMELNREGELTGRDVGGLHESILDEEFEAGSA